MRLYEENINMELIFNILDGGYSYPKKKVYKVRRSKRPKISRLQPKLV